MPIFMSSRLSPCCAQIGTSYACAHDFHYSRDSMPFREVGAEVSPMLAIRSSPSGQHLLVLFRGAPSEIWVVRYSECMFTCVVECMRCFSLLFITQLFLTGRHIDQAKHSSLPPRLWSQGHIFTRLYVLLGWDEQCTTESAGT